MEKEEASVQLVLAEKKLHFESGEQISIPLKAIGRNIGELKNIQYQWTLYRNGLKQFTKTTSTNAIVVGIHQIYAGYQFKVELLLIGNKKNFSFKRSAYLWIGTIWDIISLRYPPA